MAETDLSADGLQAAASSLLSSRVEALEPVGGGRNSRVYRLRTCPSRDYALKVYFRHASDNRTRLETEFGSLTFLWRNGIRNIPEPVIASPQNNCAVYAWIDGRKIGDSELTGGHIDAAASFLERLAALRTLPDSSLWGPASEAHFSGTAVVSHLHRRLQPLLDGARDAGILAFLNGSFLPALEQICAWSRRHLGPAFDAELPPEARTLSPSDFGFHNALETAAGEIFFLDLEYFGWDDPAKMISDFLLHPAMSLTTDLKRHFTDSVIAGLQAEGLGQRVQAFYPLFGLKWCLILLNEFLPEHLLRRRFAGMNDSDRRARQAEQLVKAERKLRQIQDEYEHFPYLS